MADTTGKDTPATDPATTGKSGPVKPPVLEGTARPSASAKPGEPAGAEKTTATRPDKPAFSPSATPSTPKPRSAEPESNGSGAWLAGLLGGAIGLGAAYGLAWFGLWPVPTQPAIPADPRLAQFATAIPELETVTGTVQDELSTLTGRVGALETGLADASTAAPAEADPALSEDLAALSARVDELAAASGDAAASDANTQSLAAFEADLASLQAETANTAAQLAEARQQLSNLSSTLDESTGADAATIRLPLIFSGLESAFAAGRSFETELAALRRALPETLVPEAIAGRAATGLPQPEMVQRQLETVLPNMLAGRPASADANWQDATTDWFRGLIAMRPAGDVEGDTPDAGIARLEAAVARRNFDTAQAELSALPEAMRQAAGSLAEDIASLAAAEAFLTQLRTQALTGESGV